MYAARRRDLLRDGGACILGASVLGRALGAAAPAFGASTAPVAAHAQTFSALVESVGLIPSTGVDSRRSVEATRRYVAWHDALQSCARDDVVHLLQRIETGPEAGFSALQPKQRLDFLRAWTYGTGGELRTEEDRMRNAIATSAVSLAASPFHSQALEPDPAAPSWPPLVTV